MNNESNRKFRLLMVFCGLFTILFSSFAQIWTNTSAPPNYWNSIASSADGTRLVAAVYFGDIYTSTNSGATWMPTDAPNIGWQSVASSADGTKLVAAAFYDTPIYVSTNSGTNWSTNGPNENWQSVACSSDGNIMVAAANLNGPICISTNMGITWTQANIPNNFWISVACSADGTKLVATGNMGSGTGPIYTSTNVGATWIQTDAPILNWSTVASSSDGAKLVAAATIPGYGTSTEGQFIYTSTNAGCTWEQSSAPREAWSSVASSADGAKLIAASYLSAFSSVTGSLLEGGIFTSTNSGATWIQTIGPSNQWGFVATSADGNKSAVTVTGGAIYTSQIIPTPQMNIASSSQGVALSWLVPSTNFILQENSDLTTTNWTTVTNVPTLNFTNLQYQFILSPSNCMDFYRLATP